MVNPIKERERSIMIIDDEPDVLFTYSVILKEHGYQVKSFADANEALFSLKEDPDRYCLILIDLHLGEISGILLARSVREMNDRVRIVIATASDAQSKDLNDAINGHVVNDVLRKPIDNIILVKLAKRACNNRHNPGIAS